MKNEAFRLTSYFRTRQIVLALEILITLLKNQGKKIQILAAESGKFI
jgi:hypothetical protein